MSGRLPSSSIRFTAMGAQGLVVVHLCHHDDLHTAVEPVEQQILLELDL